jgi:hypothetical protein
MNKQRTAVELIIADLDTECKSRGMNVNWDMYLQLEKSLIIKSAARGYLAAAYSYSERFKLEDGKDYGEQYYNETFGKL